MGKSPKRWIKTVLFGKKSSSKLSSAKGKERTANEKDVLVSAKASEADVVSLNPVVSNATLLNADRAETGKELESRETANILHDGESMLSEHQDANSQGFTRQDAPSDPEIIRQVEAATLVQAAFRGYLARRAFWALKGIIRLQALIRGHLVRRQAVATLCSVLGIVKLQALARGRKVRNSDIGQEIQKKCNLMKSLEGNLMSSNGVNQMAKLSVNAFVRKLLASSPTVMPLRLNYDSPEPNSVTNWAERWSASRFWRTVPQPKKIPYSKAQRKQVNGQVVETETSRPKRSVRRVPAANVDNTPAQANSEHEKPKRNLRKVPCNPVDTVQENLQYELEKVKRNLRKVHNPVVENSVQLEGELEKPKQSLEKVSAASGDIIPGQSMSNLSEKMKKETSLTALKQHDVKNETILTITKSPDEEKTPEQLEMNEESNLSFSDQAVFEQKLSAETAEKDENTPIPNGELNHKQDLMSNENQKLGRKASSIAKQERTENGLQSSPALPSYMAATESAKAKLRAQGSPRLSQDGADKNATRRHSLPSSTNSKISSQSPRIQRVIHSGGKAGNKGDKSLLSSRDGNAKGVQVEWRR